MSKLTKGYGSGGMQAILDDIKTYFEGKLAQKANTSDLGTAAYKNSINQVSSGSSALVESGAVKTALDGKVDKHGTDSLMTAEEHTKLAGISAGANVNVQADWNESDSSSDAYIANKPDLTQYEKSGVAETLVKDTVGWTGKNRLPLTLSAIKSANTDGTWSGNSYTYRDVVWDIQADNDGIITEINANGTANASSFLYLYYPTAGERLTQDMVLNGCPVGGDDATKYILAAWQDGGNMEVDEGEGVTVSSGFTLNRVYAVVRQGFNAQNLAFYPMLRKADIADPTFEPYHATVDEVKADKVTNATSGHLAGLDSNGNLTDSGVSPTEDVTVEGNPVTFDSPFEQDAKSVVVSVKPIQDLHGYDHPWPAGGGKNKWSYGNITTETESDVPLSLSAGTYTFSGVKSTNNIELTIRFNYIDETSKLCSNINVSGETITFDKDVVSFNFSVAGFSSGDTITNIMIEAGSSATSYEPYSNICPISGIDEVEIEVSDGEGEPTTTTIALPSTLYDADVDVTNGDADSEFGIVDENDFGEVFGTSVGGLHWCDAPVDGLVAGNLLSNMLLDVNSTEGWYSSEPCCTLTSSGTVRVYGTFTTLEEFKTQYAGLQVCYELATPTTISFTPADVELLGGMNVVSTNGEKVAVTYKAGILATLGDIDDLNDKVKTKLDKKDVAKVEGANASKPYAVGDYMLRADGFYRVTANIASGAAITSNNTTKVTVGGELANKVNNNDSRLSDARMPSNNSLLLHTSGNEGYISGTKYFMNGNIAMAVDQFSASNTYEVGSYTVYQGQLYKCTVRHFESAWDSSHFAISYNTIVANGTIAAGTYETIGSDYAENFETLENCPVCRFVTLDGEKIRLAQPNDYILGITSESPSVIGDSMKQGISVGLLGKLWVEHDGSAEINGYVISGENGIAIKSDDGYRVMAVDGNKCKVLVK